jgi:hypothetical protein
MAYIVLLGLGQAQDFSALVVAEHQDGAYRVRHIERWTLGTGYPTIVRDVQALLISPRLAGRSTLLVDHTGCGRPVVDMLRQAGLVLLAVSIHGGDNVSFQQMDYRTPKRDLVGAVQVLLQQERLQIAEALPLTPILTSELQAFRVKIDPLTTHDSYSFWRERDHDDLVLALALACWWGQYSPRRQAGVW